MIFTHIFIRPPRFMSLPLIQQGELAILVPWNSTHYLSHSKLLDRLRLLLLNCHGYLLLEYVEC